jgi:hypothetical protein
MLPAVQKQHLQLLMSVLTGRTPICTICVLNLAECYTILVRSTFIEVLQPVWPHRAGVRLQPPLHGVHGHGCSAAAWTLSVQPQTHTAID